MLTIFSNILIIFAIMLTQNVQQGNLPNRLQIVAALLPALLLAALAFVIFDTDWRLIADLPAVGGTAVEDAAFGNNTFKLSKLLLENYALAFAAAGALLLAAVIGALSLVRDR